MCEGITKCLTRVSDHPRKIDSKYVDKSAVNGLQNVVVLHEDTPPAVLRWVIKFYNDFFDGGEHSFLDQLQDVQKGKHNLRKVSPTS